MTVDMTNSDKQYLRGVDSGLRRAHLFDEIATAAFYIVSGSFVLLLIAFTLYVVWGGVQAISPEIFSFSETGIGNQFFNTVYLVFLSLVISVPIGIAAGIYMAEYAPEGRVTNSLRIAIETLSSLPSIVVGLFGYLVFIIMVNTQWNLFSGALAVSILSLPLITTTTYDAFKALPLGWKHGSLALGGDALGDHLARHAPRLGGTDHDGHHPCGGPRLRRSCRSPLHRRHEHRHQLERLGHHLAGVPAQSVPPGRDPVPAGMGLPYGSDQRFCR